MTKASSCGNPKRPRDLFDIYLAVAHPRNWEGFRSQLARLKKKKPEIYSSIGAVENGINYWEHRLPECFSDAGIEIQAAAKTLRAFLNELGVGIGSGTTTVIDID